MPPSGSGSAFTQRSRLLREADGGKPHPYSSVERPDVNVSGGKPHPYWTVTVITHDGDLR